jgi:hypothetical protein
MSTNCGGNLSEGFEDFIGFGVEGFYDCLLVDDIQDVIFIPISATVVKVLSVFFVHDYQKIRVAMLPSLFCSLIISCA